MSPKVAIVVLVLLVVVFVAGLGSGACSGPGSIRDAEAGPLGGLLGGVLVVPLDLDTVTFDRAACRSGDLVVVQPGQTCTLTVPKQGPATRRLKVVQGTMTVTFIPSDPTFADPHGPRPTAIPNQDTSSVDVISVGGTVVLTCQTFTSCVLRSSR